MIDLKFRNAGVDDIPALVALVTSAYRGDVSRQGWTTEADFLDGSRIDPGVLRHDIERPRSRVLIAGLRHAQGLTHTRSGDEPRRPESKMLACAHVSEEDGAGYFGMFSVQPGLQGGGVGKALLAESERVIREDWRLPAMRMTVIDIRDELIAFYERRGYHRTGIYKPFPYGDARFGIPKRDDLRFEVLEKHLEDPA
ncbi:MAG: GNAT family N-acetyltransferase [Luteimonas sp.]